MWPPFNSQRDSCPPGSEWQWKHSAVGRISPSNDNVQCLRENLAQIYSATYLCLQHCSRKQDSNQQGGRHQTQKAFITDNRDFTPCIHVWGPLEHRYELLHRVWDRIKWEVCFNADYEQRRRHDAHQLLWREWVLIAIIGTFMLSGCSFSKKVFLLWWKACILSISYINLLCISN